MIIVRSKLNWDIELGLEAFEAIGDLVDPNGTLDALRCHAVASIIGEAIHEAYAIGLCVGAASKEDKVVERKCFRNLN